MDHQVQPVHIEIEELPVPRDPRHGQPAQRRDRRVVRLQRGDREHVHARDHMADHVLPQEPGQRLHLRQLRHASSINEATDNRIPQLTAPNPPCPEATLLSRRAVIPAT
jgi:hypothetical protein